MIVPAHVGCMLHEKNQQIGFDVNKELVSELEAD